MYHFQIPIEPYFFSNFQTDDKFLCCRLWDKKLFLQTEYEGQVKKFMEVMEKNETDGIIAAGGGGTLLEVSGSITGVVMINGAPKDGGHIACFVSPLTQPLFLIHLR